MTWHTYMHTNLVVLDDAVHIEEDFKILRAMVLRELFYLVDSYNLLPIRLQLVSANTKYQHTCLTLYSTQTYTHFE